MFVLGLTGSIAMGKSAAAETFRAFGVPVFDADAAVHELLGPGGAAVRPVTAVFPACRAADGGIDRRALGRAVFADRGALSRLEAIVHPLVQEMEHRFLARCCADRRPVVVLDIPLLYETGGERLVDAVAVVSAPAFLQRLRVLRRGGMSPERLAAIRARQLADREKRGRADFVIPTGGPRRQAVNAIGRILHLVRHRRGRAWPHHWTRRAPARQRCDRTTSGS